MKGSCLCGAVTVTLAVPADRVTACHCLDCQQWTGSTFLSLHAEGRDVTVSGPVKTFSPSGLAERGFCITCGTCVFYRIGSGEAQSYGLAVGLFPEAADLPLAEEFLVDQRPAFLRLSGAHPRRTGEETVALSDPELGGRA